MFMIASATAMVIIFMVLFSELYGDTVDDKHDFIVRDYAYALQTEFIAAAEAKEGYMREIIIPDDLEGFDYIPSISNSVLVINYSTNSFSLPVPKIKGDIHKGENVIEKINDTICVNC